MRLLALLPSSPILRFPFRAGTSFDDCGAIICTVLVEEPDSRISISLLDHINAIDLSAKFDDGDALSLLSAAILGVGNNHNRPRCRSSNFPRAFKNWPVRATR